MDIIKSIKDRFSPVKTLNEGVYHSKSSPQDEVPYRLHLRLHKNGGGVLVVNASTVLQLNATASEYAYQMISGTRPEEAARKISSRYRINKKQALEDYNEFVDNIMGLIQRADLDPVSNLGFTQALPNSAELSAPLRLDCALTYRLPQNAEGAFSTTKRVERELSTVEWQEVIDKAWAVGIPHIIFTGGEATLRDDLLDLISHAEKNGQVTGLLTDGNRLTDGEYLNSLLLTGLDHIMLILPVLHEPDWSAIKNCVLADIFLAVHLTVTPDNLLGSQSLLQKLRDAGVENVSLSSSDMALIEDISHLSKFAEELGFRLISDLPVPYSQANPVAVELLEDAEPLGAGKTWLYVEPDGDVLPAQGMAEKILGNILKDSWETIYPAR